MTCRPLAARVRAAVLVGLLLSCALPAAARLPNWAARALQQTLAPVAEAPAGGATAPAAPGPAGEAAPELTIAQLLSLAACPGGLLDGGVPAPFLGPLKRVEVGGIEWGYHTFGPARGGPPVLLLSGMGASMYMWPPQLLTALAAGRQVTIADWPGIGATQAPGFNYSSVDEVAEAVLAFVDAAGLDQPDIIAWSLGSIVTMRMAELDPGALGSLVLVAPLPGGPGAIEPAPEVLSSYRSLSPGRVGASLFPLDQRPDLAMGCASPLRVFAQAYSQTSLAVGRQQADMVLRFLRTPLISFELPSIASPVLIVQGELDPVVPAGNAPLLAAALTGSPRVVLAIVPGAAHAVAHQETGWFISEVKAFLGAEAAAAPAAEP